MRKIIVGARISMDGVMQAPSGPADDLDKGFKFGGWARPYQDQDCGEEFDRLFLSENTISCSAARPTRFSHDIGRTRSGKTLPTAASRRCSTRSRSTWFRARAGSIRAG